MTITGRQIREARTRLKWDRSTLARRTALPLTGVERAEASDGEPLITVAQEIAIKHALTVAGVEFTVDTPAARARPTPASILDEA